ncbi:hypothetical protein [Shimia sagamensis]|uniref:Uncharacterized protein n=1 Tax=Shimia sagamensis TaxID=1566352 RepID=A0ABY1PGD6_9RHOB|nr:hypothetical protein [Shimia sagamensis]SMP31496.1 hypothetical protein SAMN06265373_1082 [Shimia sagamensis]
MTKRIFEGGEELNYLGEIGSKKDVAELIALAGMSPEERQTYFLEEALNTILESIEDYEKDTLIPLVEESEACEVVAINRSHLQRWVTTLMDIPNFVLNDALTTLLVDMVGTKDVEGHSLDIIPEGYPPLRIL